ncbi:MAG: GHKL domain-containing protein [Blautia sp.]|nr:GHKL domain-containing protein [Blautia sp.]
MGWLDLLILFFCCVIEIFLIYDYFYNFFEIKIERKYIKTVCAEAIGAIFLINILQSNILNLVLIPIILWIFVTVLFDFKLRIRFVYFIMAYIVMIGVEFLYIILSNTTIALLAKTGLIPVSEYLWQLLLIKFLNYIVFIVLKQMSAKSKNRMTNKLFLIYLCVPVSTLGTMLAVLYSGIDIGNNIVLEILMTLFFVCMITGNMVLFYVFQKYTENLSENANQELELLYQRAEVERLTKIAEWNENYNEIIHNTSHYLKVIGQLAYERRNDEICKVVDKLNGKLNREEICEYSNHKMLNIILSEYSIKAKNAGVGFDVYVEPGCILNHVQDVDFITMIGNLLDNAILAASKREKDSYVIVRIFMQKDGKLCVIKVVNDFAEELKEVRGKLISTKKEAGVHGIGLSSVSKIARQYNGYLEHYIIDGKFNAVIVLTV